MSTKITSKRGVTELELKRAGWASKWPYAGVGYGDIAADLRALCLELYRQVAVLRRQGKAVNRKLRPGAVWRINSASQPCILLLNLQFNGNWLVQYSATVPGCKKIRSTQFAQVESRYIGKTGEVLVGEQWVKVGKK